MMGKVFPSFQPAKRSYTTPSSGLKRRPAYNWRAVKKIVLQFLGSSKRMARNYWLFRNACCEQPKKNKTFFQRKAGVGTAQYRHSKSGSRTEKTGRTNVQHRLHCSTECNRTLQSDFRRTGRKIYALGRSVRKSLNISLHKQ